MITWYKCSEKMPEVGDVIVLFREYEIGYFIYPFKIHDEFYIEHLYGYWAYASDFNFPKDLE